MSGALAGELGVETQAMPVRFPRPAAPKIVLYSHDTFGLGNIRRTLLLAETLRAEFPGAAILIVTGSPVIHAFRIPAGVDYIKLPCLDRVAPERYEPRFLESFADEVMGMRRAILRRTLASFGPDLLVVDKRPGGIDGELLESLADLRADNRSARIVLGMRDILDEPERTRLFLRRSGAFRTLERFYDEIWIYGMREVFDATAEYQFPAAVRRMVRFTGYLGRALHSGLRVEGPPRVVVTSGGGGDGSDLIATYLEGVLSLPRAVALRSQVVLGPEMPADRRCELVRRYGHLADVEFCDFDPDPLLRYARADVVVAMAGYNTVCELLSLGVSSVLVPRRRPVCEQWIRARRLAELGWVDMVDPDELRPDTLIRKVLDALEARSRGRPAIDLSGTRFVAERSRALLGAKLAPLRLS